MPGTLLLDCEGLSKLYRRDPKVVICVEAARLENIRVGTTAMTRLEAEYGRVPRGRISWVLSRLDVHDVTRTVSDAAAELLRANNLHGHKYAIDAVLAAIALAAEPPVTIVSSDPEDLTSLCGPGIGIIKV
ncbi:DNA-binding protein [Nocardia donostiensis]|uniref:DNA-binding protein n=1 Tax=Nocardia donostiensis TaxID=1538463 RepID=A0A1W0AWA0_9NOCA|nr:DNA-binding protein [Nocardia donostiensis]ONM45960.1 DNA-binding protein [Nocardia donostiensis]OQS14567.1 DNA-binding protein [Nocardia donostiensis]OQS18811.1 DNA-binding protein [Nocardia donostiensis]